MSDVHTGMMQAMQKESPTSCFMFVTKCHQKDKNSSALKGNLCSNEDNKILSMYVHTDISRHYVVISALKTIIKMRRP